MEKEDAVNGSKVINLYITKIVNTLFNLLVIRAGSTLYNVRAINCIK